MANTIDASALSLHRNNVFQSTQYKLLNYEPDHLLNRTSNFRLNTALNHKDKSKVDSRLDRMNRTHEGFLFNSLDNKAKMKAIDFNGSEDGKMCADPVKNLSPQRKEAYL